MLLTSSKPETWAALIAVAASTVAWQPTVLVVCLLTACSAMDVLAAWQARRTLVALARTVPAGLITIHHGTSKEQVARLVWGAGSDRHRRQSRT